MRCGRTPLYGPNRCVPPLRCMEMALKDGGVERTDVGYINAHGTSTQLNDKIETKAIKDVFGEHAYKLKVPATLVLLQMSTRLCPCP